MRRLLAALCLAGWGVPATAPSAGGRAAGQEWPTVRGNVARTGWVKKVIRGPYQEIVQAEWPNELIMTRYEPIAAEGLVFVGTYYGALGGRIHALDAAGGKEVWTYEAGGPVGHSPAIHEGKLYFGAVDGCVYCLEARSGKELWKKRISGRGGFVTSPCIVDGLVLMGARDGVFYAVAATDGAVKWKYDAGIRIANTAAAADGVVYFMSEDIRAHALKIADGSLVWKSGPFSGQSARAYYPVVCHEKVIFRTNPGLQHGEIFQHYYYRVKESDETARLIREDPAGWKTFHSLDRWTGQETMLVPVPWQAGEQGVPQPPVFTPDGKAYGMTMAFGPGKAEGRYGGYEVLAEFAWERLPYAP